MYNDRICNAYSLDASSAIPQTAVVRVLGEGGVMGGKMEEMWPERKNPKMKMAGELAIPYEKHII